MDIEEEGDRLAIQGGWDGTYKLISKWASIESASKCKLTETSIEDMFAGVE